MVPESLSHYRILHPLGKGGMGEVYAAEDTRLHRTVALKILPAGVAIDGERRKRFEREAQAIAALNHPNIVTIHSVEEDSGVMFLTMEAVEGRTLKELLEAGPLSLDVLLRIAIAVGDAMAAAHQRGITHRDLKPANVMVTPEGRVKVVDFGLAKLREVEQEAAAEQPTRMQSDDLTGEGRIIGTVAYMSPEQAEGKPVDHRSDIFSAGVMLYEMAAGERPFKGDTNISVISSILKDTPSSVTDLKPGLPAGLGRIVRRCLAKDPGRRYQTATDLRNDLEELKQDLDSGVAAAPVPAAVPRKSSRTKLLVTAVGAVVVLVAAAFALWTYAGGERHASSAAAVFGAERFTRLTSSGSAYLAALSRDGRYVVHVKDENGQPSVWVRQTATTSDVRIVPPADVRMDGLAFSPDGTYVYYVAYPADRGVASLYRVAALGGAPIRVLDDIDSAPAFSPDGRRIAFVRGDVSRGVKHLMVAGVDGSGARSISDGSADLKFANETPAWSPDGKTLLVPATRGAAKSFVAAVDAATGTVKVVGETWVFVRDVQWMPDGRSFVMDGLERVGMTNPQIWQVTYPSGERHRITNDLSGYIGVSISADGQVLATVQSSTQAKIWVVAAAGGEGREIAAAPGRALGTGGISWTPDGRLVFTADSGAGGTNLWISRADGSDARQLNNGETLVQQPAVSGDGRWIYYTGFDASGTARLFRMGIDGADQRPLITGSNAFLPVASPDGRWVYFSSAREGFNRPMKAPADGGEPSSLSDAYFAIFDVSGDGSELMGVAWNDRKQRSECAVLSASGGAPRLLGDVPIAAGGLPQTCRFKPRSTSILYGALRDGVTNLFTQPMAGGAERQITRFRRDGSRQIYAVALAKDGRLAVSRGNATRDVVLISAK